MSDVFNLLDGVLEVGFPDVSTVYDTERKDLVGSKLADDLINLFGVSHSVNVKAAEFLERVEDINVVDNISKVRGHSEGRDVG